MCIIIQIASIYLEYDNIFFKAILIFWNRLNLSKAFSYLEKIDFAISGLGLSIEHYLVLQKVKFYAISE